MTRGSAHAVASTAGRTGRRPGESGTRDAILDAARRRFAEAGFEKTTIRAIARDASVDPALIHHFFGTKQELLAACLALPADPAAVLRPALAGPRRGLGARLAAVVLELWEETPFGDAVESLLRSAVSNEEAAAMLRQFITTTFVGALAGAIDGPDAELRAELAASHLAGLFFARRILQVEPLASAPREVLVGYLAPALQHHLAPR